MINTGKVVAVLQSRKLLEWLVILNTIAAVLGFWFWYGPQLSQTPWFLWLFVPDSPLFAAFFVIAALALPYRARFPRTVSFWLIFTSIGLVKYGVGASLVHAELLLTQYQLLPGLVFVLSGYVIVSHLVMALQPVLLVRELSSKNAYLSIALALVFFLINDWLDFFSVYQLAPVPITSLHAWGSVALTMMAGIVIGFLWLYVGKIFIIGNKERAV